MAAEPSRRPYVRPHWTLAQRLDHYTDKSGGPDACWTWKGAIMNGYGSMRWMGRSELAHRLTWIATHGPIPKGLFACHKCDNPPCINPAHIFIGPQRANMADMYAKGRGVYVRGIHNGRTKLTESDVRTIRNMKGHATTAAIAKRFGMGWTAVNKILRGVTWKHVK